MVSQAVKPAIVAKIPENETLRTVKSQNSQAGEIYQFKNLMRNKDEIDSGIGTGTHKRREKSPNPEITKNRFSSYNEFLLLARPENSNELFLLFYIPDQTHFLFMRSNYFPDRNLDTYSIKAKDKLENQEFEFAIEERYETQMKWPKTFKGINYNVLL